MDRCGECGRTLDLCLCDDEDEGPGEAIVGSAEGGENVLDELLLELSVQTHRLKLLLDETDDAGWKEAFPRYRSFLEEIGRLPSGPGRRAKVVGFKVRPPAPKATRRRR